MKILQVSNIVSHHQIPLAKELRRIVGNDNFVFAAMQSPDPEREKLGWDVESSESWIINPSQNRDDMIFFEKCWQDFDVVICGERLFKEMQNRVDRGKVCFYMSERWWKPKFGMLRLLSPKFIKMSLSFNKLTKSDLFHYLPIGPYAENDIKNISNLNLNVWSWGYYTSSNSDVRNKHKKIGPLKVMWAGRMLSWKRVDILVKAIADMQSKGSDVELTLIGDGPEKKRVESLAKSLLQRESYSIRDSMPAKEIPYAMAEHDVYVLSSTEYEGWGAVVNEAMSVGCAVVACSGIGSASAMIEDTIDGLLFETNNWKELSEKLIILSDNRDYCQSLGEQARIKIENHWSPVIAAERLVEVSNNIINGDEVEYYNNGPMSKTWSHSNK